MAIARNVRCSTRRSCAGRSRDAFVKLDAAPHGAEPGHVRRARRQRAHHARARARCRPAAAATSASRSRSRSGSGSPSSSRTSPRRWPRGAARRRRTRCAKSRTQTHGEARSRAGRRHVDRSRSRPCRAERCAAAISCSACRATSSRATARSSKASRRSTSRRSPASPRRSSASPAAIARRSPAAREVLSDYLVIRITANPGETFLDRMIALVEGASRQKTPNEIALTILLSGLTIIFLFAVVTLQPFAIYSGAAGRRSRS